MQVRMEARLPLVTVTRQGVPGRPSHRNKKNEVRRVKVNKGNLVESGVSPCVVTGRACWVPHPQQKEGGLRTLGEAAPPGHRRRTGLWLTLHACPGL